MQLRIILNIILYLYLYIKIIIKWNYKIQIYCRKIVKVSVNILKYLKILIKLKNGKILKNIKELNL